MKQRLVFLIVAMVLALGLPVAVLAQDPTAAPNGGDVIATPLPPQGEAPAARLTWTLFRPISRGPSWR